MKIYNVRNGKEFFKRIAECNGSVELVNEKGLHLQITPGKENPDLIPMNYIHFNIDQMELKFEKPEDCLNIVSYLSNDVA